MGKLIVPVGLLSNISFAFKTITTVASTDTSLTVSSERFRLFSGSATLYKESLPDATTLTIGDTFVFTNGTVEVVFIENYGSTITIWNPILPMETIYFTLVEKSTTTGKWSIIRSNKEGEKDYRGFSNNFHTDGWSTSYVLNGGGTSGFSPQHGYATCWTNTSTNALATLCPAVSVFTGLTGRAATVLDFIFTAYQLSTVTDEFYQRLGVLGTYNWAETFGFYWKYDRANLGTTWFACKKESSSETPTDTGITVATPRNRMTIVTSSARTTVWFFYKGALVATHTLTDTSSNWIPSFGIQKTAGTASCICGLDRADCWTYVNARGM